MDWDWTAHPWVVAVFALGLTGVTAVGRWVWRLFHRVGSLDHKLETVDAKVDRVDGKVDKLDGDVTELAKDLRGHMREEGESVARLEGMLHTLMALAKGRDRDHAA